MDLTLLVLALELLDEVVHETVVEVLTTKVSVTSGGLDFEDTLLDRQEGNIESSSSKIEDEDITFADGLLVKAVRDSGRSWLVNDTKDVETGDGTRILGGLTLRVVEVRRYGNNSVVYGSTEIRLSGLLHLQENHRGNLFWRL